MPRKDVAPVAPATSDGTDPGTLPSVTVLASSLAAPYEGALVFGTMASLVVRGSEFDRVGRADSTSLVEVMERGGAFCV
jgi:hypothetical protein